jgi:hypothetical protein
MILEYQGELTAFLSTDEGQTLSGKLLLDERTALKGKDWQRIVRMPPRPEAACLLAVDAASRMGSARFAGPLPNCSHPKDTNEQR